MSFDSAEAHYLDPGDDNSHENCRTDEDIQAAWIEGARMMREYIARHVPLLSFTLIWRHDWGPNPDRPETITGPYDDT